MSDIYPCQHERAAKAGHTASGAQRMRCPCGERWTISGWPGHYLDPTKVDQILACVKAGMSLRAIAAEVGVSKGSVHQYRLLIRSGVNDPLRALHEERVPAEDVRLKPVGLDALTALVVEPKRDEDFYPLLLFKGNQSLGRIQALWNFTRAMKLMEAPSVSAFCRFSKQSPDARHLLGLHARVQHLGMRGFLSRLWHSPTVLAMDADLRDYLAALAGAHPERFYWQLVRVPFTAQWKTTRAWRLGPKTPKLRAPRTAPVVWPFVSGPVTDDHALVLQIDQCVPKGLPEQIRQDVCQDLVVAVLSGDLSIGALQGAVAKHVGHVFKMHPMKYGPLSLDAPAPWRPDDDRPLSSLLATE